MTDEPLARFRNIVIDAAGGADGVADTARFWAGALGLTASDEGGEVRLEGPTPQHRVWIDEVPEPKTVKDRIHLDVHTASIADLEALGAHVQEPIGRFRWAVLTDPQGNELCGFVRDEVPAYRLYELGIDSADPTAQARWWSRVLGGELDIEEGAASLSGIDGVPFESFVFVAVPEPKTVKNRIHWDVLTDDPQALVAAGATVVRPQDDELEWDIMADPEGNEFCVFATSTDGE